MAAGSVPEGAHAIATRVDEYWKKLHQATLSRRECFTCFACCETILATFVSPNETYTHLGGSAHYIVAQTLVRQVQVLEMQGISQENRRGRPTHRQHPANEPLARRMSGLGQRARILDDLHLHGLALRREKVVGGVEWGSTSDKRG